MYGSGYSNTGINDHSPSASGETRTVCENRGSGIRAMVSALRAAGMSPSQFDDRVSSFTVTIPNHALPGSSGIHIRRYPWLQSPEQGMCSSLRRSLPPVSHLRGRLMPRLYRLVEARPPTVSPGPTNTATGRQPTRLAVAWAPVPTCGRTPGRHRRRLAPTGPEAPATVRTAAPTIARRSPRGPLTASQQFGGLPTGVAGAEG
ncbi:ATP-binding protein [Streptosporangium soli]